MSIVVDLAPPECKPMNENSCLLYSIKEVSKILRVTPRYTYDLVHRGLLPAIKLGSLKVRQQDLDAFLSQYSGFDLSDLDSIKPISDT